MNAHPDHRPDYERDAPNPFRTMPHNIAAEKYGIAAIEAHLSYLADHNLVVVPSGLMNVLEDWRNHPVDEAGSHADQDINRALCDAFDSATD